MISASWKNIAELIGMVAIVGSLILVAYELRQSTAVSTAQAVSELNTAIDSAYRSRAQNAELDELVGDGHSDPDKLSEREKSQFFSWLRADMNLIEAAWFYYDNGIIPERKFDGYKSAACSRVTTPGGKEYWAAEAIFFASDFRESIEMWCFSANK